MVSHGPHERELGVRVQSAATREMQRGILYVVATPIGNRDDISRRALDVLREVDRIYAEDTRHSLPLLRHHGIATRLIALHEHNESARSGEIVRQLAEGGSAALISDAGTPLISDPGYRLVRACHDAGVKVSPIPGASALTAALSVSGLPTDRFEFLGFPPARAQARRRFFRSLASIDHTLVMYESTHRITACLEDLIDCVGGEREVTLARELTKRFETLLHGTLATVARRLVDEPLQQKGEFVLILAGVAGSESTDPASGVSPESALASSAGVRIDMDTLLLALLSRLPIKDAARVVADAAGCPKREIYERALRLQSRSPGG